MAGLLDKPGFNPFLAQVGLGLIMGGMAQPYGRTRAQAMGPYLQAGVKGLFPSKDEALKRQLLEAQLGEVKAKGATREREQLAAERKQRGIDAYLSPEVVRGAGSQPLDDSAAFRRLALATDPKFAFEAREKQRAAQAKAPGTATDVAGYRRYMGGPQTGQRVFPGAEKPPTRQYSGKVLMDTQVGKYYQLIPAPPEFLVFGLEGGDDIL